MDRDMNILKQYDGISDASLNSGIRKSNIIDCLKKRKGSAGGYLWSYSESNIIRNYKKFNESKKDKFPNFKKIEIDGFHIYIGRDSKSNDYLTFNVASDEDIWMHVKGSPGSHVIIKVKENLPTSSIIKAAAELAKKNSKVDKFDKATVVYCKRKFVKKESGMKDGQVKVDYINSQEIVI